MVTDGSPPAADAVANGGGVSSPQSRRRSLHSLWASVVRGDSEQNSPAAATSGGVSPRISSSPPLEEASAPDNSLTESSAAEPQPESTANNGDSNAGGVRRPAWNRPPNGVVEPVSVMGGAVSWPALSETTRPVSRLLSDTSRPPVTDGSTPSSQAPIISQPPQRSTESSGAHGNSAGNNPNHVRPRPRNRGGGGGGATGYSSGNGPSQRTFNQPIPPPFPVFDLHYGMMPAVLDNSLRGPRPIVGGVGTSQSHTSNDHSSQRSNSRRGNHGPRPRGDGQYHNNHGRHDQDRRDVHHPPQYVPSPIGHMGYRSAPLPPVGNHFMPPPPMRVFPGQIGFDMSTPILYVPPIPMPPDSFRSMPIPPPPPMIFPSANENSLTNMIIKQIDFYFSDDNLVKDIFLRSNMDNHGWVPVPLIASFRRVQQLTNDIPLILESLRHSDVVEVQGDKVRRRNEWNNWLLSTSIVGSDRGSGSSSAVFENVMNANQLYEESTSQSGLANVDNSEEAHLNSL